MTRTLRKSQNKSTWFHIFNRGSRHQAVFFDEDDKQQFVGILSKLLYYCPQEVPPGVLVLPRQYIVDIGASCFMTNHFHFLMKGNLEEISLLMGQLISRYVRKFNAKYQFDGSLFRGRFGCVPIESDEQLIYNVCYTHRNSLSIQDNPDGLKYRWSSYSSYLCPEKKFDFLSLSAMESILDIITIDRTQAIPRFIELHHKTPVPS